MQYERAINAAAKAIVASIDEWDDDELRAANDDRFDCMARELVTGSTDLIEAVRTQLTIRGKWGVGALVEVTDVDEFGFAGRDPHPDKTHIGRRGYVLHVAVDDDGEGGEYVVYDVGLIAANGVRAELLEFVQSELKRVKDEPCKASS